MLSSRTCLKPAKKGIEVVGQAGSVSDALAGIEATEPEALTLDISLPDGSGVEVLKQISRRGWDHCVMVFTGNPYEGLRAKCQQTGDRSGLGQVKRVGTGSAGPTGTAAVAPLLRRSAQ